MIFDPLDKEIVKLEGANLVEASAGTGKTYSIGLLVLRLILEEDKKISRILMVTFTRQAVAELAGRIRKFLELAIRAAEGEEIDEKPIQKLLQDYQDGQSIRRLKAALSELDEASIQTIHSFCQESLNQFALESDQGFGLELQSNDLEIAKGYVKQFWRTNISSLSREDLTNWGKYLTMENFLEAVKSALEKKEYSFDLDSRSCDPGLFYREQKEYREDLGKILQERLKKISETDFEIKSLRGKNKEKFLDRISTVDGFISFIQGKCDAGYQIELMTGEGILKEEREEGVIFKERQKDVAHSFYCRCIKEVEQKVEAYLKEKQLLTYDEIIVRMRKAVDKRNFKEAVREKFDAVFIDEFQDTDRIQYEIYNILFGEGKMLFYIGDPKQSIYGWRKADLNTYFDARRSILPEKHFRMSMNYRSTPKYVEAMNECYGAVEDPFKTGLEEETQIKYEEVESSQAGGKGLLLDGKEIKALQVFHENDKPGILKQVRVLVHELKNGNYSIDEKKVKYSDIGILVRTGNEGSLVKEVLTAAGIPAVTIDDTRIFENSSEARSLLYIMEAVLNTTEKNINKALLNEFTRKDYLEIAGLEKEELLEKFRIYRETWQRSGIYAAMRQYMSHFDIARILMETDNLRTLTNLTQLLELLQEAEYRQELKPSGLYSYLQKQIQGPFSEEDEYVQRVESDEVAVKIMTIHKAKGLQFPVVITPFLDLLSAEEPYFKWFSYRDPADKKYKFYSKSLKETEQQELYEEQKEQENCRLLYVALTRAKYNCFVFRNGADYYENSILSEFLQDHHAAGCLELQEVSSDSEGNRKEIPEWQNAELEKFSLPDKYHGKLSFSALSAHGSHVSRSNSGEPQDAYDKFIFKEIPGGKTMGNMLHYLFENIDFMGDQKHVMEEADKLLDKFYPHRKEALREKLAEMVEHVLEAEIEIEGTHIPLRALDEKRKLNEMEFDYNMSALDLKKLKNFDAGTGIEINCNMAISTQQGLLNGLIDLFFEYKGKYYILDWKSNYLGDHISYYKGKKQLREAMNAGNYHLQYFIYSLAAKKYLEARLKDFSYERDFGGAIYVYLRGARKDKASGIYTNKPSLEQIERLEQLFKKKELQPA